MISKELTLTEIKEFANFYKWSSCYACALINNKDCDMMDCRKCKYKNARNKRVMR